MENILERRREEISKHLARINKPTEGTGYKPPAPSQDKSEILFTKMNRDAINLITSTVNGNEDLSDEDYDAAVDLAVSFGTSVRAAQDHIRNGEPLPES